ncbi:MAG TPA: adenylyl-sulfate kinase [Candidatus Thermoplasmatota archaeon]|nr:adenylyl-sulfate kinase [Candidatus Thermoplasmatota archaeon]
MNEGFTLWLTGIQAAGKTTLATALEKELKARGLQVENLDGDEVRKALSPNLGYTEAARDENTRRLAWLAQLLSRNGVVAIVAAVSPRRAHRDRARAMNPRFVEVYVKASLETVKARDPKGLYAKAERGEVNDLVGVHQPYEEPLACEVICDTDNETEQQSLQKILSALEDRKLLPPKLLPIA